MLHEKNLVQSRTVGSNCPNALVNRYRRTRGRVILQTITLVVLLLWRTLPNTTTFLKMENYRNRGQVSGCQKLRRWGQAGSRQGYKRATGRIHVVRELLCVLTREVAMNLDV